jgi:hypothetical protein
MRARPRTGKNELPLQAPVRRVGPPTRSPDRMTGRRQAHAHVRGWQGLRGVRQGRLEAGGKKAAPGAAHPQQQRRPAQPREWSGDPPSHVLALLIRLNRGRQPSRSRNRRHCRMTPPHRSCPLPSVWRGRARSADCPLRAGVAHSRGIRAAHAAAARRGSSQAAWSCLSDWSQLSRFIMSMRD